MKKVILSVLIFSMLFCFAGCREYSPEEAKEIYSNNQEVFQQVVDICVKYQVPHPIERGKIHYTPDHDGQTVLDRWQLSWKEKSALKKCGKIGCQSVYSALEPDDEIQYVKFFVQHPSDYQGIIVFLSDLNELLQGKSIDEIVLELNYGTQVETEKLGENTYYYRVWGDPGISDSSSDISQVQ